MRKRRERKGIYTQDISPECLSAIIGAIDSVDLLHDLLTDTNDPTIPADAQKVLNEWLCVDEVDLKLLIAFRDRVLDTVGRLKDRTLANTIGASSPSEQREATNRSPGGG